MAGFEPAPSPARGERATRLRHTLLSRAPHRISGCLPPPDRLRDKISPGPGSIRLNKTDFRCHGERFVRREWQPPPFCRSLWCTPHCSGSSEQRGAFHRISRSQPSRSDLQNSDSRPTSSPGPNALSQCGPVFTPSRRTPSFTSSLCSLAPEPAHDPLGLGSRQTQLY